MVERFQGNPGLYTASARKREELAKLFICPSEEIFRKWAEEWKKKTLSFISQGDILRKFEEFANQQTFENFSRPFLCASLISDLSADSLSSLLQVAKISPVTFVTNFDAIESFALVAALVLLAEGEIRGTTNEFLSRTIITRTGLKDEEAHVAFIDGKNVIEAAAKLLQKDPKGFLLVDEAVRKLKGKDSPLPRLSGIYNGKLRIKNFVIAGAEAGAALYKQLYALCPPPKIPLKPVT